MTTPPKKIIPEVHLVDGKITIDSRDIAKNFGKRHDNVVQSIENLGSSREFNALNFQVVEYKDKKGEKRKSYEITRDGFSILVMGFTGKEAMGWKEAYISAFNQMEQNLLAAAEEQPKAQKKITSVIYEGVELTDAPRMETLSAQQHWDLEQACEAAAKKCNQPVHVVRGLCALQQNVRYLTAIPEWRYTVALNYVKRLKPESGCFKDAAMFDKPDGHKKYQIALQCLHQIGHLLRDIADEAEEGKEARERLEHITQALLGKGGVK